MSMYLLREWKYQRSAHHTPIDDLESAIWLLIYISLLKHPDPGDGDKESLASLEGYEMYDVLGIKFIELNQVTHKGTRCGAHPLFGLVLQWFRILSDFDNKERVKRPLTADSYLEYYKAMRTAGFGWLEKHEAILKARWKDVWEQHPDRFCHEVRLGLTAH